MKKTKNCIYVVREGDTLNSIAAAYNLNPTQILLQNNITPKMIQPGMALYLPNSK